MKLHYYVAILAITIPFSLQAQTKKAPSKTSSGKAGKSAINYKVNWGPDLKLKGAFPDDILLFNEKGFYATTASGSSDYLSKFNNRMELDLQAKLEVKKSDSKMKDFSVEQIMEFNNAIYVITREKDKDNKTINYFAEKVNLTTLMSDGNKKKIYEADYSTEKKRDDMSLGIFTGRDKKNMVLYEQHPAVKEENIKVTVSSLDENLNSIWKKDVELPLEVTSKEGFSFDKYVDSKGTIYLLAKVYINDGKKKHKEVKDGELTYDYHIYTIGKDIDNFTDYAFNLKDKAVSQVRLDVNKKGEMVACGFYADIRENKDKTTGSKGVFYTTIDPLKKEIKSQSYKKFENEVFTAGMSAKKKEKAEEKMEEGKREGDATGYLIRDLVPREDGGATMFAEMHYTYTVSHYNAQSKTTTYTTHYIYGNIIITKVNAAGEIEWSSVIPKFANISSGGGSGLGWGGLTFGVSSYSTPLICSYLQFDEGNDTYDLFFNDDKDNLNAHDLETKGVEQLGRMKNMRFVRVVVNSDGSLTKREEAVKMSEDDEDTRFYPKVSAVVSDNEIILYGVDHKRDKFAKITFNNLEKKN